MEDEPLRISPKTSEFKPSGPVFDYNLSPWSISALKLKWLKRMGSIPVFVWCQKSGSKMGQSPLDGELLITCYSLVNDL